MDSNPGTIVVGVDGSESSDRALLWAAQRATAARLPLTLVHAVNVATAVYLDPAAVPTDDERAALLAEGQAAVATARARVQEAAPGLSLHEVLELADPREVLLELSRTAAMVVVGSRGRGRVRSLLLGSVGVALARHALCPVVVHRPGNPGTVRHGVLVGADGSEESRVVLEFAYREAALSDLPLTVLHCLWDNQATSAAGIPLPAGDPEEERLQLAQSMAGLAEKYPEVVVRTETITGLPQNALVRRGERMNLVVVGAHQEGLASRILFGSVSIAVIEHATSPVAVVPLAPAR